jgi:hypothetical protein
MHTLLQLWVAVVQVEVEELHVGQSVALLEERARPGRQKFAEREEEKRREENRE